MRIKMKLYQQTTEIKKREKKREHIILYTPSILSSTS